mgnify:CR=1 FL=1
MSHNTRMMSPAPMGDSRASVCQCGRGGPVSGDGSVNGDSDSRLNVGDDALAVAYNGDTTMATADNTTKEKKMSKTVNIVCYLKADSDEDERAVMDSLDDSTDYYKEDTREIDTYYVVTRRGVKEVDEDTAEMLRDAEGEELMVRRRTEETTSFTNNGWRFSGELQSQCLDGVDKTPPSKDIEFEFSDKVKADGAYIFKARSDGPSKMGMLTHPSKVDDPEEDGIWDDKDADLWVVTLTLEVRDVDPTTYRFYENKVIPKIKQQAAGHDWVERTRVMDCSKEMTEEGACYDVF